MTKLIITQGLPASGKSTWANEQVSKNPTQWKRVNKDDLRKMLHGKQWNAKIEKFIEKVEYDIAKYALEQGHSVIVDDTNLHPKHPARFKELAEEMGAEFSTKKFDTPPEECIKRDLKRMESVGEAVIMRMFNQFIKPPSEVYTPPEGKPQAIVVDIDGTLAHMKDRGPFDWKKVGSDELDDVVFDILNAYKEDVEIILLSGRDSVCREETIQWLRKHHVPYHDLFMRPKDDNRKDSIVKRELFEENIRENYQVVFVLDDRNQVVEMWRSLGLKVLQVAEGNF